MLESFDENGSMGLRCTNCDWQVVATSPYSLNFDETIYAFEVSGNPANSDNIRSISHIMDINFVEAKKFLENSSTTTIIRGVARDIDKKVDILRQSKLAYRENPKYPYSRKA